MRTTAPFVVEVSFGSPAFDELLALRDRILRQPLGLVFTPEQIAPEFDQFHLGCYIGNFHLVGSLTLAVVNEKEVKMRQVAIDGKFQGKGFGGYLVRESELFCRDLGFELISMHARDTAIPFYERLGYKRIGEPFTEVTIRHYKMCKRVKD